MEMNRQDEDICVRGFPLLSNMSVAKEAKRREPTPEVDRLAYDLIGAAIEVHRVLGPGFLESVYHQALKLEFQMREIPYKSKPPVAVKYKGHQVGEGEPDFIIGDFLIVELKAALETNSH